MMGFGLMCKEPMVDVDTPSCVLRLGYIYIYDNM